MLQTEPLQSTQLIVAVITLISGFVGGGSFVAFLNFLNSKKQLEINAKQLDINTQKDVIDELNKIIESERKRFSETIDAEHKRCAGELSLLQQRLSFVENQLVTVMSGNATTNVTVTS